MMRMSLSDSIFKSLKHCLVGLLFFVFTLSFTYISNLFLPTNVAEAGGGNFALEPTQQRNFEELESILRETMTVRRMTTRISAIEAQELEQETTLDQIAWLTAQTALTSIVNTMTDWVASGFQGEPRFVQNLQADLLDEADQVAGEFIDQLGGLGSFVCSPFRLDVQIAIDVNYRTERSDQREESCRLTDIISNVEAFLEGSTVEGGWASWFSITANPTQTPYGSVISARNTLRFNILNEQGQVLEVLDWSDGFLATQICEQVQGPGGSVEECFISNPGAVINQQVNDALGIPLERLVAADEWNELVTALFGQLAQRAVTGINGLLGMAAGTGYTTPTNTGQAYLEDVEDENALVNTRADVINIIDAAIANETAMANLSNAEFARFQLIIDPVTRPAGYSQNEIDIITEVFESEIAPATRTAQTNLATLNALRFAATNPPTLSQEQTQQIVASVFALPLHTETTVQDARRRWPTIRTGSNI